MAGRASALSALGDHAVLSSSEVLFVVVADSFTQQALASTQLTTYYSFSFSFFYLSLYHLSLSEPRHLDFRF